VLGFDPGVSHACCGHGRVGDVYAQLGGRPNQDTMTIEHSLVLRGDRATRIFAFVREWREDPAGCDALDATSDFSPSVEQQVWEMIAHAQTGVPVVRRLVTGRSFHGPASRRGGVLFRLVAR
jgi:hypothetical protein